MTRLDFHLFGGFAVIQDGKPIQLFPTQKSRALFAYLALNPGQAVSRARLAALFWPEAPPKRAAHSLRQALSSARRAFAALPVTPLRITRQDAGFHPNPALCRVDVLAFRRLAGQDDVSSRAQAAALYRGPFLAGFDLAAAPAFETWRLTEQERLQSQVLSLLDHLADYHLARGEYGPAQRYLRQALGLDAWHEAAHRGLMRAYALSGNVAQALAQYEKCRQALADGLGVEPLPSTQALAAQLADGRLQPEATDTGALPLLNFVGRGREHAQLTAALSPEAATRLILVEGEVGSGKSRLLEEFGRFALSQGHRVLRGGCYEFGAPVPFQPLAAALRQALAAGAPDLEPVWLAELSRLLPELADRRPDLSAFPLTTDEAARQRLFTAVSRLLTALIPPDQILLLILDDLHWADQATLDLLHFLIRDGDSHLLCLGAYRPEETPPRHPLTLLRRGLHRDRLVSVISLAPLAADAIHQLAVDLVGRSQADGLAPLLQQESEGNPFVLTELLYTWQAAGHLAPGAGGAWRLDLPQAQSSRGVSANVREVILGRAAQLTPASRRDLQLAAVIGRTFDAGLLQAVSARPDAVAAHLAEWRQRRLVRSAGADFDFAHDKIREVIYHDLPAATRRRRHGQIGAALAQRAPEDTAAADLAYHFFHSETPQQALPYLRQAIRQAENLLAFTAVIELTGQALSLETADPETRFALLRQRQRAFQFLHRDEEEGRNARAMLELAQQAEAPRLLSLALRELSRYHFFRGQIEEARAVVARARTLVQASGSVEVRVRLLDMTAMLSRDLTSARPEALRLLAEAYALARTHGEPRMAALVQTDRSVVLAEGGEYGPALAACEAGVAALRQEAEWAYLPHGLYILGGIYRAVGQQTAASEALEEALAICRERALPTFADQIWLEKGRLALAQRDVEQATAAFAQVQAMGETAARPLLVGKAHLGLGQAARLAGDAEQAIQHLTQALRLFDPEEPRARPPAQAHLALALLAAGDADAAVRLAADAVAVLESGRYVIEDAPHVYWSQAQALLAIDDRAGAAQARAKGRELVLARADTLPEAYRNVFVTAVPLHRALLADFTVE